MNDYVKVCRIDQVPDAAPLAVEVDGRPVAIFRIADKYYAIEDVCPHQGASFEGGECDGEIVTCPQHGWKLNVVTGESREAPGVKVETYEVKIDGDELYIRL